MDALLGIDLGTTGCKAALYSTTGRVLGTSYLEYPLMTPRPGVVEQDADLWWELAQQAMKEALAQSSLSGHSVLALSVSSQGISFVPIDREGRALRPAINWLDSRATAEAAAVRKRMGDDELFQLTGKRPAAFYVLPKLLWLRQHEPAIYRSAYKYLLAHDLLIYRLCGATVSDYSLAGGSLLLDLHDLTWSERLLSEFAIDREQLTSLAWAGTVAGELSTGVARGLGLCPQIPVAVGGQDQKCAALGAGIGPGRATVSLGTASAITCLLDRPALDPKRRIPTFPFVVPGWWGFEGVVSTAGAALKWVRNTLFPGHTYAELDQLASQSPRGANGVRFYPHLAGAASPLWQDSATGAFTGLSLAAGAADIARAVLEGVAFQVRANLQVIEETACVDEVILFGGGARSPLWAGVMSEVTHKPVRVTETVDVANWGACVLAGAGAGIYSDCLAPELYAGLTASIEPAAAGSRQYDAIYQEYSSVEGSLVPRTG